MSEHRRWYIPGGTCFFTVVTQDRVPIFRDPLVVRLLGDAIKFGEHQIQDEVDLQRHVDYVHHNPAR